MAFKPPLSSKNKEKDKEEFLTPSSSSNSVTVQLSTPLDFFDEQIDVPIEKNVFRVYRAGKEGVCVVFIHGAACCAMNFSLVVRMIKPAVRVVAIDMRGHGDTHTDNDTNLDIEILTQDIISVGFFFNFFIVV
jgi:protein phosphatase methylesterase 1